jgi:hypothetical protein
MALLIRFFRARQELAVVPKMPLWLEVIRVVTEYGPVVVALPYVGRTCRAFWNKHTLV